jgi:hypothetical protein
MGFFVEAIDKLKKQSGKNIGVASSATLIICMTMIQGRAKKSR